MTQGVTSSLPPSLPSLLFLDPKTRPSPHSWKDQRKTSSLPGLQSQSDKKPKSLLQQRPCMILLASPCSQPPATFPLLAMLQSYGAPPRPSNTPGTLQPQGLCTASFLCWQPSCPRQPCGWLLILQAQTSPPQNDLP